MSEDNSKKLFMETALKCFGICEEAERYNRQKGLEVDKFALGDQWPDAIKNDRSIDNRPCLAINQIPKFTRDVTNELRMNRPSIKISPSDDQHIDSAQVREGMIRAIMVDSHADVAIDTAVASAVNKGWGYFRILTEYCEENSFEQEIKVRPIKNAFTVYADPFSDPFDPNFMFIASDIEAEDYKQQFPDSEASSIPLETIGDSAPMWAQGGAIRVAEYWRVERTKKKIYLLADGTVVDKLSEGQKAVKERETEIRTVKMSKINGIEVLEESEWAGKYIPIIPVLGEDHDVDGKRILKGMVEDMMDPQRQYNYWTSASTEAIALAPKAPFIMAEGQQEGYEGFWQSANQKNYPYLLYKPITINGTLAPAPIRQISEPPVQAMMLAIRQANEDLRNTTGIYNESLGEDSNATSGKAIIAKQRQGNVATYHYGDNLSRSLRHAGIVLDNLIPFIYDTARIVNIVHEDGTHEPTKINQKFKDGDKEKHYDLSTGKYSVVVETGPSYSTRRQEAAEGIAQLAQAYPPLMQVAGDILVKNLDWPEAQLIAKRLKVMLPPQVQAADEDEENAIPPQVQQMMAEMKQVIETGQLHIQDLEAQLKDKTTEQVTKSRELDLKDKEVKLKAFDSKVAVLKEVPAESDEVKNLLQQVDDIAEEGNEEERMTSRKEQMAMQTQMFQLQQAQAAQKDADIHIRQEQHVELMKGLTGVIGAVGALVDEIKKPTVAIYDDNGTLLGTRKE